MLLVYVDDCIIVSKRPEGVEETIKELEEQFKITNKEDITDYLGVRVQHLPDGRIKLSQPHLIDAIIRLLGLGDWSKGVATPALSLVLLHKHQEAI